MKTVDVQGVKVPSFLYGTAWKEDRTADLVGDALDAGFRGIDTANQRKHYHEAGVGEAVGAYLSAAPNQQSDLFLQTKFTSLGGQDHRLPYDPKASIETQVIQSFESSLEHLGVDRIDSLLIHGPHARYELTEDDRATWRTMEALRSENRVRLIGISNVTAPQIEQLVELAGIAPAFVQNRCFAQLGWDREVRAICQSNGITYQGFSLLTANARELSRPEVRKIATRHQRTIPQITFRFAHQLGMIPLTGTTDRQHMNDDLAIFDFELDEQEMQIIEGSS